MLGKARSELEQEEKEEAATARAAAEGKKVFMLAL